MTAELARVFRFIAAGLVNTGFGYACYALLILSGTPLWLAVAGTTVLGLLFNFFSYGGFVYGGARWQRLPRFLLFYAVLGSLNYGLIRFADTLGSGPLLAQAGLLPLISVFAYIGMKHFVFTDKTVESSA